MSTYLSLTMENVCHNFDWIMFHHIGLHCSPAKLHQSPWHLHCPSLEGMFRVMLCQSPHCRTLEGMSRVMLRQSLRYLGKGSMHLWGVIYSVWL